MRYLIIMSLVLLLAFGCVNPPQAGNNTTYSPPVISNGTNVSQPSQNLSGANYANFNDNVSVMYALYVDGKLYDTNNATLANESGIYNPGNAYIPFNFTVALDRGIINGFVLNIIGMEENETLSFRVAPEKGYGAHDPSQVVVVPRYYEKNLTEVVPRSYFTERNLNVSNGTGFKAAMGTIIIQDFNDENVTIFYLLDQNFTTNGIPQKVVESQNFTAKIEFDLDVNGTYALPDPQTGQKQLFRVTDKTGTNITLDANHPLAGKTLDFTVTMLDIQKAS